jgi:actin related protein 2/3 complex subunit 1A/1B
MATRVTQSINYHAWNKDRTLIALAPNTDQVNIYSTNGQPNDPAKWTQKYVLLEHMGTISGIDWCASTNQIVTCGHDRNAYVWKYETKGDEWKPTLVILRINRAATAVKWSPAGNKFAVASGAKCIPVCHFEASNDWFISKMLKDGLRSTVTSVAWCPNNKFVIAGSTDFKARIYSAYIEGIDSAEDDGFGEVFPKQHEFGEVLAEFDQAKAWVNTVSWSPGGFRVAFSGHGSTMHFVQLLASSAPIVQTVYLDGLPYMDADFVGDGCVVAAGYDRNPHIFGVTGGSDTEPQWGLIDEVDKKDAKAAAAAPAKTENKMLAARAAFATAVDQGKSVGGAGSTAKVETAINTVHQNSIANLQVIRPASGNATSFSSAGLDGRIITWDLKTRKQFDLGKLKLT